MLTARATRLLSFALLALLAVGCSGSNLPDMGQVSGVVTLDGAPYANAYVVFSPTQGRPSEGVTDSEGKYKLNYMPGAPGALLGNHKVSITTQYQAPENPDAAPPFVEPLPAKYNIQSTLTATVQPGNNQIDFALTRK